MRQRYRHQASDPQDCFRGTLDYKLSIFEWDAGSNRASIIISLESCGSKHVLGKTPFQPPRTGSPAKTPRRRRVTALAQAIGPPIQSIGSSPPAPLAPLPLPNGGRRRRWGVSASASPWPRKHVPGLNGIPCRDASGTSTTHLPIVAIALRRAAFTKVAGVDV